MCLLDPCRDFAPMDAALPAVQRIVRGPRELLRVPDTQIVFWPLGLTSLSWRRLQPRKPQSRSIGEVMITVIKEVVRCLPLMLVTACIFLAVG